MRNIILAAIAISFCSALIAQNNFSGQWVYNPSDRVSFIIDIEQDGNSISGTHSGVYQGGNRYDGSLNDNDITINGTMSNNVATISINSGYEARIPGTAKLELMNQDSLRFILTTPPSDGIYYMPKDVILKRVE